MTWDDLNHAGPCGHAFADGAYLDLIGRTFRGRIEETSSDEKGNTRAVTRLLTRRSPVVPRAVVAPYTPYSAFLLDRMPTEAETHSRSSSVESLLAAIEAQYNAADIHLPPSLVDVRTFSWRKWAVRPLYTYRIELDRQESATSGWSESARRLARKEADRFEIDDPGPAALARLSSNSYEKSGREAPLSRRQLETFLTRSVEELDVRLFGAREKDSGEFEAAVAVLQDSKAAYYWIAGGSAGPGMTVLLGHLLPLLADENLRIFDFVGANTDSIAEFKRRFGGRLTTYFRAVWRKGPLVAVEDAIRSLR